MSSKPYERLETDQWGDRYFVAQLDAFRIFGRRFDELTERANQEMLEQFASPEFQKELEQGLNRLTAVANEAAERLAELAKTHPDHYAKAQDVLKQLQTEFAGEADSAEQDEEDLDEEEGEEEQGSELRLPDGQVKVDCGEVKKATKIQRILFDWLEANQAQVAQDVKARIYKYYKRVYPEYKRSLEELDSTAILLPEIKNGDELDDTIRLTDVRLHESEPTIGLVFSCLWEDEHGLGVLIEKRKVTEVGYSEITIFV